MFQTVVSVIYIQIHKKWRYIQIIKNQKSHCVRINLGTYLAQLIKGGISYSYISNYLEFLLTELYQWNYQNQKSQVHYKHNRYPMKKTTVIYQYNHSGCLFNTWCLGLGFILTLIDNRFQSFLVWGGCTRLHKVFEIWKVLFYY